MALEALDVSVGTPRLRDRKKDATRRSLREAALRLFDEKGFTATSVDEIADRAEVSRSTFFRYFGSKEAVIFAPGEEMGGLLVSRLLGRPPDEGPLVAYEAALIESVTARMDLADRELSRIATKLTREEPALRVRRHGMIEEISESIAQAFAERNGRSEPETDDHLAAAVCLAAGEQVGREFHEMDGPGVIDAIRAVFGRLPALIA